MVNGRTDGAPPTCPAKWAGRGCPNSTFSSPQVPRAPSPGSARRRKTRGLVWRGKALRRRLVLSCALIGRRKPAAGVRLSSVRSKLPDTLTIFPPSGGKGRQVAAFRIDGRIQATIGRASRRLDFASAGIAGQMSLAARQLGSVGGVGLLDSGHDKDNHRIRGRTGSAGHRRILQYGGATPDVVDSGGGGRRAGRARCSGAQS